MQKRAPMARITLAFLKKFQTLRHDDLSLTIIAPGESDLDSYLFMTDILDVVIKKTKFDNPKVGVWFDCMEKRRIAFWDIPRTSIKFDQKYTSTFDFKSPESKPVFKDEDKQFLYDVYSKEKTNLNPQERMRKMRLTEKIMLELLERSSNK